LGRWGSRRPCRSPWRARSRCFVGARCDRSRSTCRCTEQKGIQQLDLALRRRGGVTRGGVL
jgi:hypothetical protein